MTTNVYLLRAGERCDFSEFGAFTTLEKAREAAVKLLGERTWIDPSDVWLEVFPVDELVDHGSVLDPFGPFPEGSRIGL